MSLSESKEVKEIIIPSTVNRLGEYAFWSCTKLEKIDFAKGDNDEDFSEKNIDLGYHTFELCSSLKELTIPDGVTKIHCALFASYGPQRLYLPHSLKIFYEDVYGGELAHLTDVYYDGTAQEWANVERYEQGSCYKRTGAEDEEEATCDRTYDDRPLGDVNMHFTGTLLSGDCSATEDDHVEWEVVFDKETGLLKLIISGDGEMKSTSDYRKNNEEGLTENIEKQLREIHVLNKNTYIEEIVINEGVKSVGGLSGSKVKTISLPEGLKRIDTGAFRGCEQLEEIKMPTSVKEIGAYAFYQCLKLKKIDLSKTDVKVAYKAFDGCTSLKELNIPEGVVTVYCNLFAGSGLQKLYLPKSMKKFYEDYEAKTLALSCPNLTDIYYSGTKADWKTVKQYTIYEKYKPFEAQKWKRIYDNSRIGDISMHFKSATILELHGKALSLEGKIGISFFLTVADQEAYEKNSLTMNFTNSEEYKLFTSIKDTGYRWYRGNGIIEESLMNIVHHTIGGKKVIEIKYYLPAKKYSDNIKLEIINCPISVNGKVMDSYECSIQSIAEQYLAKPTLYDKKTISLVNAIHNYGSYAQLLAGYHAENVKITDDLKNITAKTLKPYAPVVEGNAKIAKYAGIGLSLSANTTMSVQFKLFDKPEEYSVEINGSKVSPKNVTGNIYYVDQNDLTERSLDRTFTITIRKGNEHYEIKVSPLSWSQSVLSNSKVQNETTVNMAKLLYRFYTYYQEYVKQK